MDIVIRVIVIYFLLLVGLRVLGKREFSQLSPLELVTLLLVPEIVSQALIRATSLVTSIIGIATLFSIVFIHSQLTHLNQRVEEITDGKPTVLVDHGRMIADHMNRERVSPDELYTEMRKQGLERLDQVRWAVLETDGAIAIIPDA